MKTLKSSVWILLLTLLSLFNKLDAQNYAFESVERETGSAFFALNKSSGQLSFMLDYYEEAGNWKNYGGEIARTSKGELAFYVHWREDGTAFFALDQLSGQLYFMLDYGDAAGDWAAYGETVSRSTTGKLGFQASSREYGTAFFALDESNGQLYFMLDHGEEAGVWKSYGGTITK